MTRTLTGAAKRAHERRVLRDATEREMAAALAHARRRDPGAIPIRAAPPAPRRRPAGDEPMTPRLAAVLGCAVGVVLGYLGTIVALSVWAWEER